MDQVQQLKFEKEGHTLHYVSNKQKSSFSTTVVHISVPTRCQMPPCLQKHCGTDEMLFAMAFLCPVSPRESDRCSHWTWKPLVMHVSLDHPWCWPEVRKLLLYLWHGNSFEFQHFSDSFGSLKNHSDIVVDNCNSFFVSWLHLYFPDPFPWLW